jgi:hypothetical protein
MIHFFKNILSKEECEFLHNQFLIEKKININVDNDYEGLGTNTYGFRPSNIFNEYMDKLKPMITSCLLDNDNNIENVNTFIREYKTGSFLSKHVDRDDIGITLSICLYSNIDKEWPLCAEIDGKDFCKNTEIGDGLLLLTGNKTVHWRDFLECNEDEYVLQFFVHWKLKKNKKTII